MTRGLLIVALLGGASFGAASLGGCAGEMSAEYGWPPGADAGADGAVTPDPERPEAPDPEAPAMPDPEAPEMPEAPEDPDDPLAGLPAFEPAPPALHRLTRAQYHAAIAALFGADVAAALPPLEEDTPLHGFASVGAAELTVSGLAAEQYEAAAQAVVDRVFGDGERRAAFVGCDAADPACRRAFLDAFGRRAWRRPLAADEVAVFEALAADLGQRFNDDWRGLGFAVSALLQSPDFLFRVERGEPDPARPGERRYTDYEMAGRLSFLIWGSIPDDALLDAAAEGRLTDDAGLAAEVDRLLADPRARDGIGGFFAEYLGLGGLDRLEKDREVFPQMTDTLGPAMRAEIEAAIERLVFERDDDLRRLLTQRTTVVGPELAALYHLPPVEGPTEVELPANDPRGGLFGMAGILALNAHRTVSSPTHRGKYVQNKVMCFDIPPPPPGVATSLDGIGEDMGPMTTRQKLERHRSDPTCAACHRHMDPIGLGLENFDAIGAYRTTENGLPIDARSELDGEAFDGPGELGLILAGRPEFGACVARQLFRHGTGHLEARAEERAVRTLGARFAADGHRVQALVRALVTSAAFRRCGPPDDALPAMAEGAMGEEEGG